MQHSTLIGGSSARRMLECPGSYQAIMALPKTAEIPSEPAEEGSFAHAVMDTLMRIRMADNSVDLKDETKIWLGEIFHDRKLEQRHLDELIFPALDSLAVLEQEYGGGFKVATVEHKVYFPNLPAAFGTSDLILISASHLLLIDWKFGAGVNVAAFTSGPEEITVLNAQLLFYLAAAQNTMPKLFMDRQLVIAIIQPRGEMPLSHGEVYQDEIDTFVSDILVAVTLALDYDPPLRRGEHCRWCPAKPVCPKWTGPIRELAALGPKVEPRTEVVTKLPSPYGEYLAHAKNLCEDLTEFKKELDAQLHAYLKDGGYVPGWTLAPKKKMRQWIDENEVANELARLGFIWDEIWQQKLVAFSVADAAAKRHKVKIPDRLRVVPESDETVVVRGEDTTVDRTTALEQFAASAAKLTARK